MAEMWARVPIMHGNTEQEQLKLILDLFGAITPEVWPGVESLPLYNKIKLPRGGKCKVC
jgi:cyclin-dependent kinase 9